MKYPGYTDIKTVEAQYFDQSDYKHSGFVVLDKLDVDGFEDRTVQDSNWVMRNGEYTLESVTYFKTFKIKQVLFVLGQKEVSGNNQT